MKLTIITFCGESPDGHPAKERGKVARIEEKEPVLEDPNINDIIAKVHEDMEGRYDLSGEDLLTIHYLLTRIEPLKEEIERLKERALL